MRPGNRVAGQHFIVQSSHPHSSLSCPFQSRPRKKIVGRRPCRRKHRSALTYNFMHCLYLREARQVEHFREKYRANCLGSRACSIKEQVHRTKLPHTIPGNARVRTEPQLYGFMGNRGCQRSRGSLIPAGHGSIQAALCSSMPSLHWEPKSRCNE